MKSCDVLFISSSLQMGGAERQMVLLAKSLHKQGVRVGVAQFYRGGSYEGELVSAGVPLYDLKKRGRWSNLGLMWRLWRLFSQVRPKVVHGYLSGPNLVLLILKPLLRSQAISVVCGVRGSARDLSTIDFSVKYIELFHRWLLRFSDAVICNSEAGLQHVTRGLVDKSKFHLVENGIDSETFCFTDAGRHELRMHWAVTAGEPLIGVVGRHDLIKDHALFLSAAKVTASQFPNARFVIVGSEESAITSDLKKQAEILGISQRVVWAGQKGDMSAVYSALDVLCLCSHSEGFPNVVAEAMSCGLPCVGIDVGDVRRLIGNAGWVVKGRKPTDLAEAINKAITALPTWDRENPRRRIIKHFSIENLSDKTLAVLAKVPKSRPA